MENKAYEKFVKELKAKVKKQDKELIFLCIGTNRVIGDSFGPMVGTKLKKLSKNRNINILGSMKEPMCRKNINRRLKEIKNYQKEKCIIAIDSAISDREENIGQIFISNNSMILGSGINRKILEIGDISIKGVVCQSFKVLERVPENIIHELSNIVAKGIYEVVSNK